MKIAYGVKYTVIYFSIPWAMYTSCLPMFSVIPASLEFSARSTIKYKIFYNYLTIYLLGLLTFGMVAT